MPQLRQNIITGDWVVIAPERAKRPQDFLIPKGQKITDKNKCPFCVTSDAYKLNHKATKHVSNFVSVIENRYPAFVAEEAHASSRSYYPENGFYRARPSLGDHEVIIVKEHELSLYTMPRTVLNEMLEVIRGRYLWMEEHEKIVSIMPIYNQGAEAGASIEHPHAQIFASGIVANTVGKELDGADKYYGINGACVYCDMIKHEKKEKVRLVFENEHFVAINFFASRFPFETWVLPKKHESQFEKTSKASMSDLTDALSEVFAMLNKTIDNLPLNFYIHTLPTINEDSAAYHWHLEIVPRLSSFGGFELGSEVVINVMSPEEATRYLLSSKEESNESRKRSRISPYRA